MRLEQQLDLLDDRPISIGWIVTPHTHPTPPGAHNDAALPHVCDFASRTLGSIDQLESIIARRKPAIAVVCLPAAMKDLIQSTRTRLRKLNIPDRFIPTLEDLLAGIGPRSLVDIDLAELLDRPPRTIDHQAIASVIRNQRVLITGAGGSIGSHIAKMVAQYQPQCLLLLDRSENALFEIDRQIARFSPEIQRKALLHDVVDERQTLALFRQFKPQAIFHAAAHKHVPMMEDHPWAAVENNVLGTRSVVDAAIAVKAQRVVMVSTDKAVNPVSIMGATKRLAELYVQHASMGTSTAFAIVRFGNVLGSSGSVLEIWSKQIADGGPLSVTDDRMTRYFMTIPEAAALVIQSASLCGSQAETADVFLLDMGQPIRILDLARRFIQLHGLEPLEPGAIPRKRSAGTMGIVITGIRPGEKLHEELNFDGECMRPTSHPDISAWILPPPQPEQIQGILQLLKVSKVRLDPAGLAADIHKLAKLQERQFVA